MAITLTVGVNTYITRDNATSYLEGSLDFPLWEALSNTSKDQALVMAARMIERQTWLGTKTSDDQALSFPRVGLVDKEGNALSEVQVPQEVIDGQCELALALAKDSSIVESKNSGSNVRKVQAGSASVEYFRPQSGGRFPTIAQELLSLFLSSSASGLLEPYASGTEVESNFTNNSYDNSGSIR